MSASEVVYDCKGCGTEMADGAGIICRGFRGHHGRAFLFENVSNIKIADESAERTMTTGKHLVHDIACNQCKETVGWMYEKAYEESQKYKEGKFILEMELLSRKMASGPGKPGTKQERSKDSDAASVHSKL